MVQFDFFLWRAASKVFVHTEYRFVNSGLDSVQFDDVNERLYVRPLTPIQIVLFFVGQCPEVWVSTRQLRQVSCAI